MRHSNHTNNQLNKMEESFQLQYKDFLLEKMTIPQCERCASCSICTSYRQQLLFDAKYKQESSATDLIRPREQPKELGPDKGHLVSTLQISPVSKPIPFYNSEQPCTISTAVKLNPTIPSTISKQSTSTQTRNIDLPQTPNFSLNNSMYSQHNDDIELAKERLNSISERCHRFEEKLANFEKNRKNILAYTNDLKNEQNLKVLFPLPMDNTPKNSPQICSNTVLDSNPGCASSSMVGSTNDGEDIDVDTDDDSAQESPTNSSDDKSKDGVILQSSHKNVVKSKYERTIKLYKFLIDLLEKKDPCVMWIEREEGMFRITVPERLAKLWGEVKLNPSMTYGKLARSFRHYYKTGKLENTTLTTNSGKRKLYYKFSKQILRTHRVIQ